MSQIIKPVLVPIDSPSTMYDIEKASDFYDVMGRNTTYVIDPEECLADNFSYAVCYDLYADRGREFATPSILQDIMDYLKALH